MMPLHINQIALRDDVSNRERMSHMLADHYKYDYARKPGSPIL